MLPTFIVFINLVALKLGALTNKSTLFFIYCYNFNQWALLKNAKLFRHPNYCNFFFFLTMQLLLFEPFFSISSPNQ